MGNNTSKWNVAKSKGMKTSGKGHTYWKGYIFISITNKGQWYKLQVASENNIRIPKT
jgi:hypothetical protein